MSSRHFSGAILARENTFNIAQESHEGWNRRDALNAGNLRWLIQDGYPGRKIIVWAHNVHVMNAHYAADVRSIHLESQPGGLKPIRRADRSAAPARD